MASLSSANTNSSDLDLQWDRDFEIELVYDPTSDNQLGAPVFKNRTDEEKNSPRELVTERELKSGRFYFHARCQRPVYGLVSVIRTVNHLRFYQVGGNQLTAVA
jgi:hypothetical protein